MRYLSVLFLVALLAFPTFVHAEEGTTDTATPTGVLVSVTPVSNSGKNELRTTLKVNRDVAKNEVKTLKETQKLALTTMKREFKLELDSKRKELRASISAEKAQFKAQLAVIKDANKKAIAERIDTKLGSINTVRTDRMASALDKMSEFLARLQARVASASSEGEDTTKATAALTSAQTAIDTARAAVVAQAAKTYTADVTDEATLRTQMGGSVTQLITDLKATYDVLNSAKKTLMAAVREVAHLGGIKSDTSTPVSGTPVPSASASPTISTTPVVTEPVSSESAQ